MVAACFGCLNFSIRDNPAHVHRRFCFSGGNSNSAASCRAYRRNRERRHWAARKVAALRTRRGSILDRRERRTRGTGAVMREAVEMPPRHLVEVMSLASVRACPCARPRGSSPQAGSRRYGWRTRPLFPRERFPRPFRSRPLMICRETPGWGTRPAGAPLVPPGVAGADGCCAFATEKFRIPGFGFRISFALRPSVLRNSPGPLSGGHHSTGENLHSNGKGQNQTRNGIISDCPPAWHGACCSRGP